MDKPRDIRHEELRSLLGFPGGQIKLLEMYRRQVVPSRMPSCPQAQQRIALSKLFWMPSTPRIKPQ